jgi:hypothetical protein
MKSTHLFTSRFYVTAFDDIPRVPAASEVDLKIIFLDEPKSPRWPLFHWRPHMFFGSSRIVKLSIQTKKQLRFYYCRSKSRTPVRQPPVEKMMDRWSVHWFIINA